MAVSALLSDAGDLVVVEQVLDRRSGSGSVSDAKSGEVCSSELPSSRVLKDCSTIATISPTSLATFRSSSATGSAAKFAARCLLTQLATYSRICAAAR